MWAIDAGLGMTGLFTVTNIFSHPTGVLVEGTIDGDRIHATQEHPFWVVDEGWVSAEDLTPGDCVRTLAGGCREVIGRRVVLTGTSVYNFTVIAAHTYFVGDGPWLVAKNAGG